MDLDFLFLYKSYWTRLDLFQTKRHKKFFNFFLNSNVCKSITQKVCIFGQIVLKIKVDPYTNLQFLFQDNSYWTYLDLFQSVLVKFAPKFLISSSSIFLWHVKVAHFLFNSCLPKVKSWFQLQLNKIFK